MGHSVFVTSFGCTHSRWSFIRLAVNNSIPSWQLTTARGGGGAAHAVLLSGDDPGQEEQARAGRRHAAEAVHAAQAQHH